MYQIGVCFAAYYDWWLRRTAKRPGLWEFGIAVFSLVIMSIGYHMPIMFWVFLYIAAVLAGLPAYLAAARNRRLSVERRDTAWKATKKTKELIDLGKK